MIRWSALAMLVALAAALALRVPQLATRPLHNDEAVNGVKVSELWQHGRYAYDPDEYHGPALHYATLPFLWLSGARNSDELNDATLRLAPVVCGVGLIFLLLLFGDGLGRPVVAWAALFIAVSPAMVFYSRYFIHEMPLVFFTTLTIGAGWRYLQTRAAHRDFSLSPQRGEGRGAGWKRADASLTNGDPGRPHPSPSLPLPVEGRGRSAAGWAALAGAGLGLMFATKETFVLSLGAMGLAGIITAWWSLPSSTRIQGLRDFWNWQHAALAFGAAFTIWLLFFSSFFSHSAGLLDSARTYLPWLKRAGGHSPHLHPWSYYLERLAWFHPAKGRVWSEGLILLLAVVGTVVSLVGKKSPLLRFLALYTIILTGLYSAIAYKTPWCLLNFYLGMILLAGVGAAALLEWLGARWLKVAVTAALLAGTLQLAAQSWRASVTAWGTDREAIAARMNPYVYAQTSPSLRELARTSEGIGRVAPMGFDTIIKVIAPDSDYWPLPWYLRRFKNVGWYDKLPADPYAPIVMVSSKMNARLDDHSDRKWIMAGLSELRPGIFLELYVELELWKKYVATLPKDRD